MPARAAIFGCAGPDLSAREADFFRAADPWGFILFGRNIVNAAQIRRLVAALREAVGREAPILIDQEGGRVARLQPPVWTGWENALPYLQAVPDIDARARAMRLRYHVIGAELAALGIDVNCAPMVDLAQPDTHPMIRPRCYGSDPADVTAIGRAVADGLAAGGVLPVLKHIPGHGRTPLDSHADLPRVDLPADALMHGDFEPFRALADLPLGMTAHIVYAAIDAEYPATQSPAVIRVIREDIGFDGLLMSDDISMGALSGSFAGRSTSALAAGCDLILHCNGNMAEMQAVAGATGALADDALRRAEAALAARAALTPEPIDIATAVAEIRAIGTEARHA